MRSLGWSFSLGRVNTIGPSVWARDQYVRTIGEFCVHVARKSFKFVGIRSEYIVLVKFTSTASVYHVDLRIKYGIEVEV